MVIASACCLATVLQGVGCSVVVQASMLSRLHWTAVWLVAGEASSAVAGTGRMTEFGLSLGEMEQEVGA